jgi:hypothetical protein
MDRYVLAHTRQTSAHESNHCKMFLASVCCVSAVGVAMSYGLEGRARNRRSDSQLIRLAVVVQIIYTIDVTLCPPATHIITCFNVQRHGPEYVSQWRGWLMA